MFIYYNIGEENAWAGVAIAIAIIVAIAVVLIVKIIARYVFRDKSNSGCDSAVKQLLDEIKELRKNANIIESKQNSDCCEDHCRTINININHNNNTEVLTTDGSHSDEEV